MLVYVHGAKSIGIDAVAVTIEVNISLGIGIHLVGLADAAVKESLLRTVTSLQLRGFHIPGKKIVINLAPADLHKQGSGYDLPIALGIIAASEQKYLPLLGDYLIMGELGLDASVRYVPGTLPMVELAQSMGLRGCILPEMSALEAADFRDGEVYAVKTLDDVLRILEDKEDVSQYLIWNTPLYEQVTRGRKRGRGSYMDFADIVGQDGAKRGVEIAAAGGHNLMFLGAPGAGKSSMAKALAGILPPMSLEESLVTSKVYSVAGRSSGEAGLMRSRPFRAPHISASKAAMLGGGSGDNILPGEVSLATNGVLFLDEFCEAPKSTLEALRAPLEDRQVCIARLKQKIVYPASFMLVAASNPCPCGYFGEGDRCRCTPGQRIAYLSKLSGPIMDRIDLQIWIHPVDTAALVRGGKSESSAAIAARVLKAREIQRERFRGSGIYVNAEMNSKQLEAFCPLDNDCKDVLERLIDRLGLSARAYTRIIKIARTIADLQAATAALGADTIPGGSVCTGSPPGNPLCSGFTPLPGPIRPHHLTEAASYRFLDRRDVFDL